MKTNMIYGGNILFIKGDLNSDTCDTNSVPWANVDSCAAIIDEYLSTPKEYRYYDRYEIWGDLWNGSTWVHVRLPG